MLVNVRSQSPPLWEILHFADPLNVRSQSQPTCVVILILVSPLTQSVVLDLCCARHCPGKTNREQTVEGKHLGSVLVKLYDLSMKAV